MIRTFQKRSNKQTVATNRNWSKRIIAAMYYLPSSMRTLTPVEAIQLQQARDLLGTMLRNWDDNTKAVLAETINRPTGE